ncbi:MAG: OmpA family protein [Polyangiaceae bacterium]|jgi:outer membrane protein OmpA-like peptidoglycan-associated protein|nr:OmpA family protein [Polyangiaceae bacterium]
MSPHRVRPLAWLVALVLLAPAACTHGAVMRGKIEGLQKISDQAERNGAIRCAPRELAMAKSHLRFALLELDQGFAFRAKEHLQIAEPNVHAAYSLSPPQACAERGFAVDPGDRDGDGYLNANDKCPDDPETWNGFQDDDGCPDDPDTDGDGVADSKDSCVLEPEDKDTYLDEDGCPEFDNDLDGILDVADKVEGRDCSNEPEDPDGYEDADGCPDLDNDQDKVADLEDICPNEPGEPGGDRPGCPKKSSLAIVTDKEIRILQQIHFAYNKDAIRPESYPVVDAVAEILQRNTKIQIEVQGHTDSRGSKQYNQGLSERRAHAVMRALVQRGIDQSRLRAKGYGLDRPIVPNDTDPNRALNRRVQFIRTESESAP